jgi:hypothetical protein
MKIAALFIVVTFLSPAALSAADDSWQQALPEGATAFVFGRALAPFTTVTDKSAYDDQAGFGFASTEGLSAGGAQWPDSLSGSYIQRADGKEFEFKLKLPSGEYLVWLSAGKLIKPDGGRHYMLQVGDDKVLDETVDDVRLSGINYLGRFLLTPSPVRAERIWESYVNVMHPATTHAVKVTDGVLSVKAANYFLAAMVILPAQRKADFEKMAQAIRQQRIAAFAKDIQPPKGLAEVPGGGDYALWVPSDLERLGPASVPGEGDRQPAAIKSAAAQGQKLILNLAVTPNVDLGACTLELADLKGPGTIPVSNIRGFFENFFYNGRNWSGSVLAPTLTLEMDKGVTRPLWLWLSVPADAKAGLYKATFVFKPAKGKPAEVPVEIEVYPFGLVEELPLSCGFWGGAGLLPAYMSAQTRQQVLADRLAWMRDIGLTSITVSGASALALNGDGTVRMGFDPTILLAAKKAGMARNVQQALMLENWMAGVGRSIAKMMPDGAGVYDQPGLEFKLPGFRDYCLDAARQYKQFIDKLGVPVVITAVDEPREAEINSWNRNFDDTVEYIKILHQAGLLTSVDPMADKHGATNKDYSPFVDYVDVLSTHAWEGSARMMRLTVARKKTLWLYNVGDDRYSWGFYNWRVGSTGRWEWELHSGQSGGEGFNPLRRAGGLTQEAPIDLCKGGFALERRMMQVSQGITDYAYLCTLEEALRANYTGERAQAAQEARDFLESLRRAMPEFPQVKGLASATDAARVGMGIQDQARLHCDGWRAKIGEYLTRLGYKAPGDPPPVAVSEAPARRRAQLVEAIIRGTHLYQAGLAGKSGKGDAKAYGLQGLSQSDTDRLLKAYDAILAAAPADVAKWIAGDDQAFDGGKAVAELNAAKIELADNLPVSLIARFIALRVGKVEPAAVRAIASLYQMVLEVDRDGEVVPKVIRIYLAAGLPVYMGQLAIDYDTPQFELLAKELSPQCCPSPVGTGVSEWHIASRKVQNWGEHYTGKVTAATYAKQLLETSALKDCAAAIAAMPARKICVIGHSFTMSTHWSSQGSFTDIAIEAIRSINPKVEFVTFQAGGLTASRALKDYADKAIAQKPGAVLLVLSYGSPQETQSLQQLVAKLVGAGAKVYLFDALRARDDNPINPEADVVKAAAQAGATVIEVRQVLQRHPLRGEFVCLDGIHMNPPYHKVMAGELVKFLCGKRQAQAGEVIDPAAEPAVKSVKDGPVPLLAALPELKEADWTAAAAGLAEFDAGTIDIGGGLRRIATRVFVGRTDKDLYVLFYSCEPDTAAIAAKFTNPQADHDKAIWDDDSVEMFLCTDPAKAPGKYHQVIINPAGVVWDGDNKDAAAWDSQARVSTKIIPSEFGSPGAWIAQAVIPLDKLGAAPQAGTTWKANFTRSRRQLNAKDWIFSWAEMSGGNFHQPEKFKAITFK